MYTVSFTVVLRLSFGGTANSRIDPVNGPYLCRIKSEQELVFLRVDPSRTRMILFLNCSSSQRRTYIKKQGNCFDQQIQLPFNILQNSIEIAWKIKKMPKENDGHAFFAMISIRGSLQEIAVRSHLKKYRFDSVVYLLACDLPSIISVAEDQRSSGYNRNHLLSKLWVWLASDTVVLLPTGDRRASFATGSSCEMPIMCSFDRRHGFGSPSLIDLRDEKKNTGNHLRR